MPSRWNNWAEFYFEIIPKEAVCDLGRKQYRIFRNCLLACGEDFRGGLLPPLPRLAQTIRMPQRKLYRALQALNRSGLAVMTEAGWKLTIPDSAMLVERVINSPLGDVKPAYPEAPVRTMVIDIPEGWGPPHPPDGPFGSEKSHPQKDWGFHPAPKPGHKDS